MYKTELKNINTKTVGFGSVGLRFLIRFDRFFNFVRFGRLKKTKTDQKIFSKKKQKQQNWIIYSRDSDNILDINPNINLYKNYINTRDSDTKGSDNILDINPNTRQALELMSKNYIYTRDIKAPFIQIRHQFIHQTLIFTIYQLH